MLRAADAPSGIRDAHQHPSLRDEQFLLQSKTTLTCIYFLRDFRRRAKPPFICRELPEWQNVRTSAAQRERRNPLSPRQAQAKATSRSARKTAYWRRDPITRSVFRVWRSSGITSCVDGRGGPPTPIFAARSVTGRSKTS